MTNGHDCTSDQLWWRGGCLQTRIWRLSDRSTVWHQEEIQFSAEFEHDQKLRPYPIQRALFDQFPGANAASFARA